MSVSPRPAVLVDDVDAAQYTLAADLCGDDPLDLHRAAFEKYGKNALLPKVEGPFAIGMLPGTEKPWTYVAHRAGVDLFRVSMRAETEVDFEQQILPPLLNGTYVERTGLFPKWLAGGHAVRVTSRATVTYSHPALTDRGGAIVVPEMANGDEGDANWTRVRTMVDLLRAWARTTAAAQAEQ